MMKVHYRKEQNWAVPIVEEMKKLDGSDISKQSARNKTNKRSLDMEIYGHQEFLKSKRNCTVFEQKQTVYFFNLEWGSNEWPKVAKANPNVT